MWYQCRNCKLEEARGCIPSVSCGIYLFSLMVFPAMFMGASLGILKAWLAIDGFGWWWLLISPVMLIVGLLSIIPVAYVMAAIEWSLFALRSCPRCGARRWSRGYTKGFGL
jgi:hypothetical protein